MRFGKNLTHGVGAKRISKHLLAMEDRYFFAKC